MSQSELLKKTFEFLPIKYFPATNRPQKFFKIKRIHFFTVTLPIGTEGVSAKAIPS